jgi:DNA polymerase-1
VSPKTLTGEELELDDAPARDAELFLVDGNNLAYRAFFALPEELATSDGFATGALLGFTNMLFKLLSDYKPKGVAVAWDTRPVHRAELAADYKEGRRPMPDLLREQFPFFRPIVEAFGYRNLEFEGWEADDVIATIATRADEAGIKTCVVSTDRDAFQLVSDNVTLMMTPRGVADVNVYTPERVEARLGITPDKVPDFIGLKGDTSDNIAGVPGIGDKTASQLIQKYGSLEGVLEHVDEQTPARRKALAEHADQARNSKELATMRRDLDIDCDPAQLVLAPPDRSELAEMFRRFEFRALLQRVDQLDEALPAAAPREVKGEPQPWREDEDPSNTVLQGPIEGLATDENRLAIANAEGVVVVPRPSNSVLQGVKAVAHDAKAQRVVPSDDTLLAAYLIEPGRASYELDDLAIEYDAELQPEPETDEETTALVRRAAIPPRIVSQMRARLLERGNLALYETIELPLVPVLADMEDAGVRIDTYRMGEITARLSDRVEELESKAYELAGEEFMLGSTQQVARILFEKLELTPGRKGKTGYSTDTRVLRTIRGEHEIVGVIEEWRELSKLINTYLGPLPGLIGEDGRLHTTINQAVRRHGAAVDEQPEPAGDPDPHRARPRDPQRLRRRAGLEADLGRLLADRAAYPRARLRRAEAPRGVRARGGHPHRDGRRGARRRPGEADEGRALDREDDQLRDRLRDLGVRLSENLEIPREQAQQYIDAYLARFPHVQDFIARTIEEAAKDGYVTSLLGRRRPVPEIRAQNRQTRSLGERLAVNFVMQGSNADIIKVAMIRIHERLRNEGRAARLVLQVHDELLLEAPDNEVSAVKDLVARRCAAPTRSTHRSLSTSARAATGTRRRTSRCSEARRGEGEHGARPRSLHCLGVVGLAHGEIGAALSTRPRPAGRAGHDGRGHRQRAREEVDSADRDGDRRRRECAGAREVNFLVAAVPDDCADRQGAGDGEALLHLCCGVPVGVAGLVGVDRAGAGGDEGDGAAGDGADAAGRGGEGDGQARGRSRSRRIGRATDHGASRGRSR